MLYVNNMSDKFSFQKINDCWPVSLHIGIMASSQNHRKNIIDALKQIKKAGIPIVGADMGGKAMWETPMKGALALILGGESKGLSPTLKKKCQHIVSVPLKGDLESLNVSVTAGILMFEKYRQDRLLSD